ncbi:DALR anticodon-binding domain-containing protein 3-like isoform X2 [Stylophora pistillata]|uniref:DALR anticodon-binding domain-containing protein 3-like isoform X2 n=1 Tax=Stylophora pistillata TaxID=50429 RepID=UPI000C038DFE|nr:DALR anticodon-binding domain-containing protein 3-like isoform X2 [Stylophora pistillata]
MVIKRCRASGPTYEPLRGTIAKTIDNMADGEFEGLYEGNFVNNGKTEFSDLLPYMKRLVCEALSTVDSLNQTNFDSCFLKLNKKLENGDLIIPAFVRNYLGEGKEISLWTEKDLTAKAKELYKILKCCKYVDSLNKKTEMQATDEAEPSCNYLCKSDCTCKDSDLNCDAVILDLPNFCKDNELLSVTPNKLSVSPTSSILLDVAKLDLAEKSIGDIDMVVHLTSCRLAFSQQQMSTVWQMTATNPAKMRQFFVSHGLVSLYKDEQKLHDHLDFLELLRTREKQLRESYIVKYGNKVEGCGWDKSLREMAVAVIKLEILSSAPNSEVKINISETSRQFRQATFVLYNCARLAKLFASFEEFVQKGVYPALPPVTEVDFRLLRDQAEWELTLHYIVAFPSVIKDAVAGLTVFKSKSQNVTIQSNKICCFLLNLSHKFSSYYGRVHVLGVSDIELKREICLLYFPSF